MPFQSVTDATLTARGFSRPAQANTFWPASQTTHIHLGVPTSAGGQIAPGGSRWVTYISLKVNDATVGRLTPNAAGAYDLRGVAAARWPAGWQAQLRSTLGAMILP